LYQIFFTLQYYLVRISSPNGFFFQIILLILILHFFKNTLMLIRHIHFALWPYKYIFIRTLCSTFIYKVHTYAQHTHTKNTYELCGSYTYAEHSLQIVCPCSAFAHEVYAYARYCCTTHTRLFSTGMIIRSIQEYFEHTLTICKMQLSNWH